MAVLDVDITCELRAFAVELSLAVGEEVLALVGPSGSGKTTVLRAVAGLHRPDRGHIACGGETWFDRGRGGPAIDVDAQRRSVGYVPQHHALFPHLTVARNVAFSGADAAMVDSLLARLRIAELAGERPARLSGGERQRVALARALARRPRVLLLDEPLAALDAHTRVLVRDELAAELAGLGIPSVLVTHDFADAAALAGRVAVIAEGRLRQLGSPAQLLAAPADRFVAALTGASVVRGRPGAGGPRLGDGGELEVAVHPWDVEVRPGAGPPGTLSGTVVSTALEGTRVRVRVGGWVGEAASAQGLEPGRPAHGVVRRAHVLGA
ncbi:ABC transporter ATP-binding protein [Baekduia soli]|uniref:ABC transporter ATP-binding protein n=1 Tax=Baekduia soli TaxID=496014 RepID=A0A5B8U8B3_9ACTN|nr:ABC transporter ATP-binding protein [Baekduia soli]QEC49197.1 ABC transporter ATP-binding protein [Baekduia soli]